MPVTRSVWGQTPQGETIELYTLSQGQLVAHVTNLGAALVQLQAPDRAGQLANITLGFDKPLDYLTNPMYLGATVGRFANRIGKGQFWLEGKPFQLAINNGPNHLHGGLQGFHLRLWNATLLEDGVTFQLVSPDGDQGYPGELQVSVTYQLEHSGLTLDYTARALSPTVLNLTNHAYWNLSGAGSIHDHVLQIHADRILETDANTLPTGNFLDVAGTPYDFRQPRRIGERIAETGAGYDDCYHLRDWDSTLRLAARVEDPKSGRVMEILTTEPGIQLYTANYFDGSAPCRNFAPQAAFCLECQHFPDSPNQPEFPSTALRPGEEYRQRTVHRFSVLP